MLQTRLQNRIYSKQAALKALQPFPAAAVRRLQKQLTLEWIYNSNALDGGTLTLRETQVILEQGIAIGGKRVRDHFAVINHALAIRQIEALAALPEPVTASDVRQLHALLMTRIDDANAGQFRKADYDQQAWRNLDIPDLMAEWEQWLRAQDGVMPPVVLAASALRRLLAIQPFAAGNGSVARLVMNLLFMRAGYPLAIIDRVNRVQYARVLVQADGGDLAPLVNLVGRALERSLTHYLAACAPPTVPTALEDQWLSLRQAAKLTPYSQAYLSLLARTGKLEASKRGRNWVTTRRAVQSYLGSVSGQ